MATVLHYLLAFAVLWQTSNARIWPKGDVVVLKDKFFVAFIQTPESFGEVVDCLFGFNDDALQPTTILPISSARAEWVHKAPGNDCGIRVEKIDLQSNGTWTLVAKNQAGTEIKETITVNVARPYEKLKDGVALDTFVVTMPGPQKLTCPSGSYCQISNDRGEVWEKCEMIATVTEPITYECMTTYYSSNKNMQPSTNYHFAIGTTKAETTKDVVESESSVVLKCHFPNPVTVCKAERPNKKLISFSDSSSGFNTTITNNECSIEIPKPFNENDIGLWTVYDLYNKAINSGCLFYVGAAKEDIIKQEIAKMNKTEDVTMYSSYTNVAVKLTCKAPFEVKHCYLRSEGSRIEFPQAPSFDRTKKIGQCIFDVTSYDRRDWTCALLGEGQTEEIQHTFKVAIKSSKGEAMQVVIRASLENTIEMLCQSPMGLPISNCVFMDPDLNTYILNPESYQSSRIKYFGNGLDKGHCGVLVEKLEHRDYGNWQCSFSIDSDSYTSASQFSIFVGRSLDDWTFYVKYYGYVLTAVLVGISLFGLLMLALIWRFCKPNQYTDLVQEPVPST